MRFLESTRKPSVINVTSLIDVMFLLLIFVLLSAKFEKEASVPVDLPSGGQAAGAEKPVVKVLTIDAKGAVFLGASPVTLAGLPEAIRKMRAENPDPVLVINADRRGSYGRFAEVMDKVRQAGQTKFSLKFAPGE